jgi:lipoyl(octanoyl) transferase
MIRVEKLGIIGYEEALARMRAHVGHRADRHRDMPDELWLTEHPPVFTLGFASRREHLHATGDIPVIATERGGQVTYHGPGQVIAYLLLDLRRRKLGVRELVCRIENGIITCLDTYGIEGLRKPGAPGIFVRSRTAPQPGAPQPDIPPEADIAKIASIGLKVSRGLTWHGLALNGSMDLEPFSRIDPCGYAGLRMTDVVTEAGTHIHDLEQRLPDDLARALLAAIEG